jgi:hypothetical protein
VGLRLTGEDRLDVFAPFGLEDIFAMVIRPNYALPNQPTHDRKAARAKAIWAELTVIPWIENEGDVPRARPRGLYNPF